MSNLSAEGQPRIRSGLRLQWEPAQECHVLLYPEGMVRLNQSAAEILRRCDGTHSLGWIVADLELAFDVSGLESEVLAFVTEAVQRRWVELQ